MKQQIAPLSESERRWITKQREQASRFVDAYSSTDSGQPFTLDALDRAFEAWLATNETDSRLVNGVINCVGIAFGQFLVDSAGLSWVIATDQHGTDLAVHGLPGKGDVLVYPANFVAKRWERREKNFLGKSFRQIALQVDAVGLANTAKGSAKP